MKNKFEKIVQFMMPYDKRHPDPNKNCGISSFMIKFVLKGKQGAVQVLLGTEFYLPSVVNEYLIGINAQHRTLLKDINGKDKFPFTCWDVGFHSKKRPKYMDKSYQRECDILGKCYYDGSSLRGQTDKVAEQFFEKGTDFVWSYLEKYYNEVFGGKNAL